VTPQTNRSTTAEIIRYGAYLPRHRAPLGEIQRFYGRPGRPRAKALATPALDEDPLTMAYEAATAALEGAEAPGTLIAVSQSPPFGLRKLSATLARALGLEGVVPFDVCGSPAAALDAMQLAGTLSAEGPTALVVVADHLVSHEDRVADTLSAGGAAAFLVGASGGFARLGPQARAGREVYDLWRLGTEPEARYRLEVLFDAYASTTAEALAGLEAATERPTGAYAAVCPSQPHPQTLRALGRLGVGAEQLEGTSFVGEIGNLGAASVGIALALGLDGAAPGDHLVALGYGGGEAIAREVEVTGPVPGAGTAAQIPGEAIDLSTYYRWTRGRQAEPH
jgi:hydroxymethylglutaryl-CoA synthase